MERLSSNLWINNVYFIEISVIGVFFVSLQYVTKSGWSAGIKRIPEAFGHWLPYGFILMACIFAFGSNHIFHWTHSYLYDPSHDLYDQYDYHRCQQHHRRGRSSHNTMNVIVIS